MSKKSRIEYGIMDENGIVVRVASPSVAFSSGRLANGKRLMKRRVENWTEVDFHQICCTNVKIKDVVKRKDCERTLSDIKIDVQCAQWMFPCLTYRYEDVKRGLESAICSIIGLESVEVTDFSTDILEYR